MPRKCHWVDTCVGFINASVTPRATTNPRFRLDLWCTVDTLNDEEIHRKRIRRKLGLVLFWWCDTTNFIERERRRISSQSSIQLRSIQPFYDYTINNAQPFPLSLSFYSR